MRQSRYIVLLAALGVSTLVGCKKEEIIYFEEKDSANFWLHEKNHSLFDATTTELPQDTVVLNIAISGKMADRDRFADAVVVADAPNTPVERRLTTATPDQYEILGGVVPAGQLYGIFKVVVKNPESLATRGSDLRIRINMVKTDDFEVGLKENKYVNLKWSREILRPETWNGMRFFFTATYSTQVYKIFMEVTGLREFYYYQGLVSEAEGRVMGRKFADRVREISAQQGSPLLHDDGDAKGSPIVPIY